MNPGVYSKAKSIKQAKASMSFKLLASSVAAVVISFYVASVHANPANDQITAMQEKQRQSMFATFLQKSGEKCSSVSKTFYQGSDKKGNAFWNAACVGGGSFAIQVNNDATGSTKILNCKVLSAVNGGTCFKKFSG